MSNKFTILSDVDGVLEDLVSPWVQALNIKYDRNVSPSDIIEWDITKFFPGLSKTQVFSPLHKEQFWKDLQPYEDAQQYIQKLIEDGDRVVLLTSAHPDTVPYKWQWINRHFPCIAFRDIIIASDKQMISGDVLIDDAPHNLIGGNYTPLLFTARHNESFNAVGNSIIRVDNWWQIYNKIQELHRIDDILRGG